MLLLEKPEVGSNSIITDRIVSDPLVHVNVRQIEWLQAGKCFGCIIKHLQETVTKAQVSNLV